MVHLEESCALDVERLGGYDGRSSRVLVDPSGDVQYHPIEDDEELTTPVVPVPHLGQADVPVPPDAGVEGRALGGAQVREGLEAQGVGRVGEGVNLGQVQGEGRLIWIQEGRDEEQDAVEGAAVDVDAAVRAAVVSGGVLAPLVVRESGNLLVLTPAGLHVLVSLMHGARRTLRTGNHSMSLVVTWMTSSGSFPSGSLLAPSTSSAAGSDAAT
eukprot:CAMPEP_0113553636 /NCGR_PEP_ID=MMETSP0015_2-20120614/15721_1 /TAXON_ID=2838 /ORGANISM="Odontella" /LENGTH=212 /DNA_ID=CAMNT_0000454723 /DNA_START=588 /DNA_END=1227 /DNA_ORIENTATION=- /assembly_acc=CAM_ASM_000160